MPQSPFKKFADAGGAVESGSRNSSLKEKRGPGGEPPEKKERTDSPEEVRSRSPVRKLENDLKGNATEVCF